MDRVSANIVDFNKWPIFVIILISMIMIPLFSTITSITSSSYSISDIDMKSSLWTGVIASGVQSLDFFFDKVIHQEKLSSFTLGKYSLSFIILAPNCVLMALDLIPTKLFTVIVAYQIFFMSQYILFQAVGRDFYLMSKYNGLMVIVFSAFNSSTNVTWFILWTVNSSISVTLLASLSMLISLIAAMTRVLVLIRVWHVSTSVSVSCEECSEATASFSPPKENELRLTIISYYLLYIFSVSLVWILWLIPTSSGQSHDFTRLGYLVTFLLLVITKFHERLHKDTLKLVSMVMNINRVFIRFISHELRSHIGHLSMGLDQLADEVPADADTAMRMIEELNDSCDSSLQILNDVLVFDGLNPRDQNDNKISAVKVKSIIKKGIKEMEPVLNMRGIDLELNISDCFELSRLYFNINEFDIKNTLKYLIGNAAKSSTRGSSISLKCSLSVKKESHESTRTSCCAWKWLSTVGTWLASTPATVGVEGGEDDQAARASYSLNITVTDLGLGLSKEDLSMLFSDLTGVLGASLKGGAASGLALPITKALVERNNGVFSVFSAGRGSGCTCSVELPVFKSKAAAEISLQQSTNSSLPFIGFGDYSKWYKRFNKELPQPPAGPSRIEEVPEEDNVPFLPADCRRYEGQDSGWRSPRSPSDFSSSFQIETKSEKGCQSASSGSIKCGSNSKNSIRSNDSSQENVAQEDEAVRQGQAVDGGLNDASIATQLAELNPFSSTFANPSTYWQSNSDDELAPTHHLTDYPTIMKAFDEVLDWTLSMIGAESILLFVFNELVMDLECVAPKTVMDVSLPLGSILAGSAVLSGQSVNSPWTDKVSANWLSTSGVTVASVFRSTSVLCVPVVDHQNGTVLGVFEVTGKANGEMFTLDDDDLIRELSNKSIGILQRKRQWMTARGVLKHAESAFKPFDGSFSDVKSSFPISVESRLKRRQADSNAAVAIDLKRFLVTDDSSSSRKVVCHMIRSLLGHRADEAQNGAEAVWMAKLAMSTGRPYDAIFMDCEMPVMDGPTAVLAIRQAGYTGCIVSFTGVSDVDSDSCLLNGASMVVEKPMNLTFLMNIIENTSIALKSYEHRINPHRAIESVNTDILAEIREESEEVADRAESFVVDVEEEAPLGPCCKAVDTVEGPCDPGCPLQNSVYMALSWPGDTRDEPLTCRIDLETFREDTVRDAEPVQEMLSVQPEPISASPSNDPMPLAPCNFLVVDDVTSNRKMLSRLLQKQGHSCSEAIDGIDCLELFEESLRISKPFDAIFMDSVMPNMDGPTATSVLRRRGYRGPIVGVTGNVLQADINLFKSRGATLVLPKPLRSNMLEKMLKDLRLQ